MLTKWLREVTKGNTSNISWKSQARIRVSINFEFYVINLHLHEILQYLANKIFLTEYLLFRGLPISLFSAEKRQV